MTTFVDSRLKRVFGGEPASFFGTCGASLGRFGYSCAAATRPGSAPAAAEYGGLEAGTTQVPTAGAFLDEGAKAPFRRRVGGAPARTSCRYGIPGPALKSAEDPRPQGSMAAAVAEEVGRSLTVGVAS